jgi:hypothetical protein
VKKVKMGTDTAQRAEGGTKPVGFWEAFWFWVKLGFINFGGPAGQIAIMHRELVEKKRWVSEQQYLRTLNFCMLLPGPEAQQAATYIGWRLHGTLGGIGVVAAILIPTLGLVARTVHSGRRSDLTRDEIRLLRAFNEQAKGSPGATLWAASSKHHCRGGSQRNRSTVRIRNEPTTLLMTERSAR